MMRKTPIALAIGLALAGQAAIAQTEQLPAITVQASPLADPTSTTATPEEITPAPVSDGGELLRNVTGVSGSRMGGQAIDPIIRGQTATQLNILLDGAYVHGGCPNRMDPPTAYTATESYDQVTVIKGSQTVLYGSGGSGGTVLFERRTPRFDDQDAVRGRLSGGFVSNADTRELSADLATGTSDGFIRAILDWKDAGNYQDGDSNEVHSAYNKRGGTVILGYTPDAATRLELSAEASRERDSLYAGAGMDSPYSDADTYRLRFERGHAVGPFDGVRAEVYQSQVDHLMDNYSLRTPPANMMMWKDAPSTSDTLGGRISADLSSGKALWTVGVDLQNNDRDAERLRVASGDVEAILWPGADLNQAGLFAELELPMRGTGTLTGGLRYDYVDASISRGDEAYDVTQTFSGETPTTSNELYALYYADVRDSASEHNIGGFLRYEQPVLDGKARASIGVSRSVRTADATERYIASRMVGTNPLTLMQMDMSWAGNPALDPEKHHQIEAGLSWGGQGWDSAVTVFYNKVSDFILRDRARAQDGILVNRPSVTIYRNVDATLFGFEWDGNVRWNRALSSKASLAYVNAQNDSDDRSIAQTPPLEASLSLDYASGAWALGGVARASATQSEVDPLSMLDVGQTSGWAVLDLYGRYQPSKPVTLSAGVNNLFDNTYAYHVNRAATDPFNPTAIQVNEPGRSLWLKAAVTF
jgi:iron complex outermembrane receptor protein